MKKKISVFALLLSLMFALVVPVQAKADTVSFPDFPVECPYEYFYIKYNGLGSNELILVGSDVPFTFNGQKVINDHSDFKCTMWHYKIGTNYWNTNYSVATMQNVSSNLDLIACSNHDILDSSGNVIFEKNYGPYLLSEWCEEAGLNCTASSNESSTVVPFWYEPANYNYIVRKTLNASSTSGIYQLTMIQKTDGQHYPYHFEVNGVGYLGIAGSFTDTSPFTVRNFYYDSEGNGWKLIERFDVSVLPFDSANVYFSDNLVFIYSDTDIYADREASSVWQLKTKAYYNVDVPDTPTPTPTTAPGSGSSGGGRPGFGSRPDTGGQATGGGGLDFIINLFTLIWTKICSIPMAVDGYNISLQQIIVYGALVSIVGGFIMHFIFGRK